MLMKMMFFALKKARASDRNVGKIANSRKVAPREPPLSQKILQFPEYSH